MMESNFIDFPHTLYTGIDGCLLLNIVHHPSIVNFHDREKICEFGMEFQELDDVNDVKM